MIFPSLTQKKSQPVCPSESLLSKDSLFFSWGYHWIQLIVMNNHDGIHLWWIFWNELDQWNFMGQHFFPQRFVSSASILFCQNDFSNNNRLQPWPKRVWIITNSLFCQKGVWPLQSFLSKDCIFSVQEILKNLELKRQNKLGMRFLQEMIVFISACVNPWFFYFISAPRFTTMVGIFQRFTTMLGFFDTFCQSIFDAFCESILGAFCQSNPILPAALVAISVDIFDELIHCLWQSCKIPLAPATLLPMCPHWIHPLSSFKTFPKDGSVVVNHLLDPILWAFSHFPPWPHFDLVKHSLSKTKWCLIS